MGTCVGCIEDVFLGYIYEAEDKTRFADDVVYMYQGFSQPFEPYTFLLANAK